MANSSAKISLGFIASFLMMLGACVKPLQPLPDNSFKLFNPYSIALNVAVYQNYSDYANNTNPFFSGRVLAYDSLSMLAIRPDSNTTYYIDLYSDDYSQTNWGDTDITFITLGTDVHSLQLPGVSYGLYRVTYLAGDSASTTWLATDRYNLSYVSVWNLLQTWQQSVSLSILKNLTASLTQENDSGTAQIYSLAVQKFFLSGDLSGLQLQAISPYTASYNVYNTSYAPITGNFHTTTDTLLLSDGLGYWVMVRR